MAEWDGQPRRASDTNIGERLARLETRQDEHDKQTETLRDTLERHSEEELKRMERVYDAINSLAEEMRENISELRNDLNLAKGGFTMAARLTAFSVPIIGGVWALISFFHDHVVTK